MRKETIGILPDVIQKEYAWLKREHKIITRGEIWKQGMRVQNPLNNRVYSEWRKMTPKTLNVYVKTVYWSDIEER